MPHISETNIVQIFIIAVRLLFIQKIPQVFVTTCFERSISSSFSYASPVSLSIIDENLHDKRHAKKVVKSKQTTSNSIFDQEANELDEQPISAALSIRNEFERNEGEKFEF
jgi:hypothetical protein